VKFSDIVKQAALLLQESRRITYRALQLEFDLTDEQLNVLRDELIEAQELAVDKDGKLLVWVGAPPVPGSTLQGSGSTQPLTPDLQSPAAYTPPHLAERIRAVSLTDGERKTITALFADIKGSMALLEDLDPEEARALVDPALHLMMAAVHRYDGYVVQSTGDGIFAFFGAPLAHEDHPQRALHAALRMQEELSKYAEALRLRGRAPIEIRVGINTGAVVLRSIRKDDLRTEYTPIGHSTGLAQRMESLAKAGSIVVSEHTYKLTEGYFDFKPLGTAQVKGVSEPIRIYEVLGVGPLRTRLQVAVRRGLVRFVGRHGELEHLRHALAQAKASHGQIVGVMGEPGVGKSRLFHEFKLVTHGNGLVLEAFSVSHGKAYPYLPLIDLLKNYFQITPQDDERSRREKITGRVLTLDRDLEDTLSYLFLLLSVAEPTSPLAQIDPQTRKRRTLEAIKRVLIRESLNQPLILIFEDLHWLDSETQAFLTLLSESVASARILLLVNYRPEYQHSWGNKTFYTQLRLDSLEQEDAQELLTALLGDDPGLRPLKSFILEKTEGNPFFMEEIVQALVEEGVLVRDVGGARCNVPLPMDLHIPTTVQGVLAARIDRLSSEEKDLVQTLAVIGKEFPLSLLTQVVNKPEEELQPLLSHLQAAEFIYEHPAFPEPEYTFKHALTQEIAYNSLLIERRKILHEQTGHAIESLFHSRLEDHYGALAHHYSRSGNVRKAIEYLQRVGEQAVQRSASTEAINHFTAALELLKTLPDSLDRARQELTLQLTLGAPLMATKGPAAPEAQAAYARARVLGQQVGEPSQLFSVLRGLWQVHTARAELRTACELSEQLLSLAQAIQDPALLLEAHHTLGAALYFLGECAPAREHLEQAFALYDPQRHRHLAGLYGHDPGVVCLSRVSRVLLSLGYVDQAVQKSHEALSSARELSHPQTQAFALFHAGLVRHFRREGQVAQEQAEALIALSREHGFEFHLATGIMVQGWALAEQGQGEEGIAQMCRGLSGLQATGAELPLAVWAAPLAEAYGKVGRFEEGLALLSEARAAIDKSGGHLHEAEMYRVRGQLMLQKEARGVRLETSPSSPQASSLKPQVSSEAEACFLKAIEIAQRQQAKSLELRATVSLARLWQQHGKQAEARQLLAEIYSWFTEGFDTADLKDAQALLETLRT
jgi:predicted ATPase/class 3 adenylate cyclase